MVIYKTSHSRSNYGARGIERDSPVQHDFDSRVYLSLDWDRMGITVPLPP